MLEEVFLTMEMKVQSCIEDICFKVHLEVERTQTLSYSEIRYMLTWNIDFWSQYVEDIGVVC